jgi:hypothetical protein
VSCGIILPFGRLSPCCGQVAYVLRTRAPRKLLPFRLACIRPAASVHPEPGSNSPSYVALVPPIAGRACILNVCRSVDLLYAVQQFQRTSAPGNPQGNVASSTSALQAGRKGNSFSRFRNVYLCFFSWRLESHWKNIPSFPPARPEPSASGMQRYEHYSYSQQLIEKKYAKLYGNTARLWKSITSNRKFLREEGK